MEDNDESSAADHPLSLFITWHQTLDDFKITCVFALDTTDASESVRQLELHTRRQSRGIYTNTLLFYEDFIKKTSQDDA